MIESIHSSVSSVSFHSYTMRLQAWLWHNGMMLSIIEYIMACAAHATRLPSFGHSFASKKVRISPLPSMTVCHIWMVYLSNPKKFLVRTAMHHRDVQRQFITPKFGTLPIDSFPKFLQFCTIWIVSNGYYPMDTFEFKVDIRVAWIKMVYRWVNAFTSHFRCRIDCFENRFSDWSISIGAIVWGSF